MGTLKSHLIKGAVGSFALQVGFAILSFFNAVILARIMGAQGYGAFANAMAWVSILVVPATFGFGVLLVRDVSICRFQQLWSSLKGLLLFSNRFVLVISISLVIVVAGVIYILSSSTEWTEQYITLWIALPLVPLFAISNLHQSVIRGLEHVFIARFPGMIFRPGLLLIGIIIINIYWPYSLNAPMAMMANVIAGLLTLVLTLLCLNKLLPIEVKGAMEEYDPRAWTRSAFSMMIYSGSQIVFGQTDIIMLGVMRTPEEVGLYAAATRLAFLLTYVTVANELIMAPIVSRLYANGENGQLQRILTKSARASFAVNLPVAILLIIFGEQILNIFGGEFSVAKNVLIILTVGRLLDVACGSSALLLSMTGHERYVANVYTGAAFANVLLNFMLVSLYGIEGAAVATIISLVTAKLVLSICAYQKVGQRSAIIWV